MTAAEDDLGYSLPHGRLGRLLAALKARIERAADQARRLVLGVAEAAGLVYGLAGQAQVRDGCCWGRMFPAGTFAPTAGDLASLLRGVVFIGEPALSLRLDFEGIGLGAVRGRDQLVVRSTAAALIIELP